MLLEELLFCTVFFVVPVVGMAITVIVSVLKGVKKGEGVASDQQRWRLRKREKSLSFPVFRNHRGMEYQLVESHVHIPIQFNPLKEDHQPRAGP